MELEKITNTEKRAEKRWYNDACGTALGMELIGERWSLLIVRELLLGPRRFGELRAGLPGLSANVLTQRLEGLEGAGIVARRKLPPPASVQVYELTPWGAECEPIVLGLGRWALRSPAHDATLHFSPVALMLSFKMLVLPDRLGDLHATVGFRLGDESYAARIADGAIDVARDETGAADAVFEGAPNDLLRIFYGRRPMAEIEASGAVRVSGDRALATRFAGLFALPEKSG